MGSIYTNSGYIERDVDEELWEMARKWLGSTRIQWVSLKSAPGRGNSWLLEHLRDRALKDELAFGDIAIVLVKGETRDGPPGGVGPLGKELYDRYERSRMKPWRRLKRRVRETGLGRLMAFGLIGLVSVILASFLKGLSEYNHVNDVEKMRFSIWWSTFVYEFLPQNWPKFPIWFFTEWIVTVPLAVALAVYSTIVYRARKRRLPLSDHEVLKHFESKDELAEELIEICHNCRGVILVIDDAHHLPQYEKRLLIELCDQEQKSRLREFNKRNRILIATLESQHILWEGRPVSIEHILEIPSFSTVELRDIARDQLLEDGDEKVKGDLDALVERAQENVNALFGHRERRLIDELGQKFQSLESKGYAGRFGVAEMMAYMAVLQQRFISKGELAALLESAGSNTRLADFGLRLLKDSVALIDDFVATSSLVQQEHKQSCYFDVLRCQSLRRWLAGDSEDHKQLLAQAHFFWCRYFSRELVGEQVRLGPDNLDSLSPTQQQHLNAGVWHAAQIGILLDKAPDVLAHAKVLTELQRRELAYDVCAAMLTAAAIYRSEGDMIEANDLIEDALDWLRGFDDPRQEQWLECAADQLWQNYWLTGNSRTRERLKDLAHEFTGLTDKPSWRVHQRFEELLQGSETLSPQADEAFLSDPNLRNLHRLTETLWQIRQTHGLLEPALSDMNVSIREPVVAPGNTIVESHMRQLQVGAWNLRDNADELSKALANWRQRLQETAPSAGYLGSEAVHSYNEARYWHLLAEVWCFANARIEGSPEEEEDAQEELLARLRNACLNPPSENRPLAEYIWLEAQSAYERALQIAALLGWRSFVMETSFHLGVLLQQHTPEDQQIESPPWWERWDNLFKYSIELERDLNWIVHTPAMHRIRWEFFEVKDHEHSIEDAYNAFRSAKRAYYPSELVLDWHRQVSTRLTNFSDSDVDRRRDAELHEIWAHELASLPAATKHWDFDRLEIEQADSLHFAAQARRFLRQYDYAERLLDEADALMGPLPAGENGEQQKIRDLRIGLKAQRAWLLSAQGRDEEYHHAILDIWRQLKPEDESCAIVLGSLLIVETKHLDEPWPVMPQAPIHLDPENGYLSLPLKWFEGPSSIGVEIRFEFRFYQLLNLVSFVTRWEPNASPSELQLMSVLNRPESLFSVQVLQGAASQRWFGVNNFGDTALRFARVGLEHLPQTNAETKSFMINLLEAVQFYFAEVVQVDRDELETLQLLMRYEPDLQSYRLRYINVLTESRYLLKHELLSRAAAEESNWFAIASQVDDYLGVLVDAVLLSNWIKTGVQQSGISLEELLKSRNRRREILQRAKALFGTGERTACKQLLQPVLSPEPSPWIFLEDLQVLDLWLTCAQSSIGAIQNEINRRAAQLRKATLQFIRQFELVIKEREAQGLATEILKAIQ